MTSTDRRAVVAGLAALGGGGAAWAQPPALAGTWNGLLQVGSGALRLRLVVGEKVHLISLDQGATVIPAEAVEPSADRLQAEFPTVAGALDLRAQSGELRGTWTQGGQSFPIVFGRPEVAPPAPKVWTPLTSQGLNRLRETSGAPALAAAWAKGADPTILATGVRSAQAGAAVTPNDLWHLGSITKSMTATLIARHVERGTLSWESTVGEVLGAAVPGLRPEHRDVTLLELLSHRAGFDGNLPGAARVPFLTPSADPAADRLAFVRIALALPAIGPRRATFLYSNNGFVTAGAMLEAKSGKSWEQLIADDLFRPLGLTSAGFGPPGTPGKLDQPVGHYAAPGAANPPRTPVAPAPGVVSDNVAPMGPAGRVHMSLADLTVYLKAHRDRTGLLKPESWTRLHTPPFGGNYALGWMVRPDGGLWHNGSNTLWYAEALVDRDNNLVAAAATNDGFQASAAAISDALMQARAAGLKSV